LHRGECPFGLIRCNPIQGGDPLARTNFKSAKRQKELERKKRMEEKRQRKLEKRSGSTEGSPDELQPTADGENPAAVS
jgi:hypothetical protein